MGGKDGELYFQDSAQLGKRAIDTAGNFTKPDLFDRLLRQKIHQRIDDPLADGSGALWRHTACNACASLRGASFASHCRLSSSELRINLTGWRRAFQAARRHKGSPKL